jgi:arylsulfatase A-like enzyme
VLFLSFNDTDSWAHEGRYDRLLDAYAATDTWLEQLWTWLQSQPEYRGRTHLLITTDHGRGHTGDGWRHHGEKYPEAARVWMAFVSPKMAQRGEWRGGAPLSTNQVAATLASWVGVDWNADHPAAGQPIR